MLSNSDSRKIFTLFIVPIFIEYSLIDLLRATTNLNKSMNVIDFDAEFSLTDTISYDITSLPMEIYLIG